MTATILTLPGIPTEQPTVALPAEPTPPAHYTPAELDAWQAGLNAGRAERDAAHDVEAAGFLAVTQAFINERAPRPMLAVAR